MVFIDKIKFNAFSALDVLKRFKDKLYDRKSHDFVGVNGFGKSKQITIMVEDKIIRIKPENLRIEYSNKYQSHLHYLVVNENLIPMKDKESALKLIQKVQAAVAPTLWQRVLKVLKLAGMTYVGMVIFVLITQQDAIQEKQSWNALEYAKKQGVKELSADEKSKMKEFGLDDPFSKN